MWEIDISGCFLIDMFKASSSYSFPFFGQVRLSRSKPAFFLLAHIYPTARAGNMRVCSLRALSRCAPRIDTIATRHSARLHHTKSELLGELADRGLIDQITR